MQHPALIPSAPLPQPRHGAHRNQVLRTFYPWYVLGILWLVALFRFIDLQILAVLLEPIKAEFLLSDTQLALLGGFAFAVFYGGLGLPIAWLADRYSRKTIIALAISLWSVMTCLCGQASSFASLFIARMGVGVGEAGAYPPSTALLADYFPPWQRSRVFAVLASAIPCGVFCGFLIGGTASQWWGWRTAFQIVGLPGILLGLVVYCTVRDPVRGQLDTNMSQTDSDWQSTMRLLWQNPNYRWLVAGACLYTMGAYGSGVWLPAYFIRHHGFNAAEIGVWMAGLYGGGGLLGTLGGGWLATRLQSKGVADGNCWVSGYSLLLALPLLPMVLLWEDPVAALIVHGGVTILMHMNIGPVLAQIQQLAAPHQRAMAQAISVLVSNLLALSLGPLAVGMFSDYAGNRFGSSTLGIGILLLLLVCWLAAAQCFHRAARQAPTLIQGLRVASHSH